MGNTRGFTLIEMLIVVVIIGLLAAVAFPTYQNFIRDARRADAKAALMDLASAMERHYSENLTYAGAADNSNVPTMFADQVPTDGGDEVYYQLRIPSADADSYTLRANPVNAQSEDGYLRLRSNGQRGWDRDNNGSIGSNETCWEDECG